MARALSRARIELLRALDAGAELRTDTSFGYPTWTKQASGTPPPPRQQAVKSAHDDGHLELLRSDDTGERIKVGPAEYHVRRPVWTISADGRAALTKPQH